MGMTREQFAVLVKAMKSAYTKPDFLPDQNSFNVWYALLQDLDYRVLSAAVQSHIQTSPYLPTVADLRSRAQQFTAKDPLNEMTAWSMVYKAICNSGYHAEEEFAKLPETVQRAVGSPANLREWAAMDISTVSSVGQSNFLRAYRAASAREKEIGQLSESMRNMIGSQTLLAEGSNDAYYIS